MVLNNINFLIKDKEKIGIVGRTGAGKSSLIQAIFRISEPEAGSVYEIGGFNAVNKKNKTLAVGTTLLKK